METPIVAPARIDLRMLVRFLGRALWKTTLVLTIPLILTVVYVAYLQRAGELLSASRIATMSLLPKRILWLTGYYDTGRLHKLDVALRIQPEVAVIGTSRSMQLRAEFFDKIPPSAFYNVGGCCANAVDAQHAVHALLSSATKPKVIILGVETWWFQSPSPNPSRARAMFGDAGADVSASLTTVVQTLSDFADRVQTLQLAWRDPRFQTIAREHFATTLDTAVGAELLGVFARATKNGFRNDGSFRYGQLIETQENVGRDSVEAFQRRNAFDRATIDDIIRRGGSGGRYLVDDGVRAFGALIHETRAAGVGLIVFVPPVAPAANAYFGKDADMRVYLARFREVIGGLCARNDVPFFDVYDGSALNASDDDFYDWLHPSERLMARLMVRMYADARAGAILQPFGDGAHLATAVAASGHRWQVHDF